MRLLIGWMHAFQIRPIAFAIGGQGFEFCVFVVGWRHALWSDLVLLLLLVKQGDKPSIIIIIIKQGDKRRGLGTGQEQSPQYAWVIKMILKLHN